MANKPTSSGTFFCVTAGITISFCMSASVLADELGDLQAEQQRLQTQLTIEQTKNSIAALELERAKTAAQSQNDIATAEASEAASEESKKYAKLDAITKAAGQLGSPEGIDGTITISEDKTGILLQSRKDSKVAVTEVVKELCQELKTINSSARIANIVPVPASAFRSISLAKMHSAQLVAIHSKIVDLGPGTSTKALDASIMAAAKSAEVIYGSAEKFANFFKSDRTIKFESSNRETLFAGLLGVQTCAGYFKTPMLQLQASRSANNEIASYATKLEDLETFRARTALKRASYDNDIKVSTERLAAAQTKGVDEDIKSAQKRLHELENSEAQLKYEELLAVRAGAIENGFGAKSEATIDDLAWLEVDKLIGSNSIMVFTLSVQDVQEIVKRWYGSSIKYRTSVDLVYQIVNSNGEVQAAGMIPYTSAGGKF